jgi:hypothetical protein
MAVVSHEPARFARSRPEWLELPAFWGSVTIVVVWLAVLFVGVFGPSITSHNGVDNVGTGSSVPSVVVVAPCAVLATWLIARNAFRRPPG